MKLTPEALAEWRASLTTERILAALAAMNRRKRDVATARYWVGQPWPEAERLALIQAEEWLDDLMTAPAEDFEAAMETDDERNGV